MELTSVIVGGVIGLVVGGLIAFLLQKSILKGKAENIIKEAEADAEALKKRSEILRLVSSLTLKPQL